MASRAIETGTLLGGRYQIDKAIGGGGLGDVYSAVDTQHNIPVAIRILPSDVTRSEVTLDQLTTAVRWAQTLSHKNILDVYGLERDGSAAYIVYPFVDGHSLRQMLDKKRDAGQTFSLKGAYNVLAHVCNALRSAHELNPPVVHGLPGPGAVLINRAGRVKLTDFGLNLAVSPQTLARCGDAYAMAPELFQDPRSASPAADVYTLGMVLYEMLSGNRPDGPMAPEQIAIPDATPTLIGVVAKCLHPNPAGRFGQTRELKAAFYAAIESAGGLATTSKGSSHQRPQTTTTEAVQQQHEPQPMPKPRAQEPPAASGPTPMAPPQQQQQQQQQQQPGKRKRDPFAGSLSGVGPAPTESSPNTPRPAAKAATNPPLTASPTPMAPAAGAGRAPAAPVAAAAVVPQAAPNIHDLLAEPVPNDSERWLVQKDRLDFGPFSLQTVKEQLFSGEFDGNATIVDQESGERGSIRKHPQLVHFIGVLERFRQQQSAAKNAEEAARRDRKSRVLMGGIIAVAVLIVGGGLLAYFLKKEEPKVASTAPQTQRAAAPEEALIKKIEISWNEEPKAQKQHRRKLKSRKRGKRRRRRAGGRGNDDVTYLGDASKSGGDQLLTREQVQRTMNRNIKKLTGCIYAEKRRNRALRAVRIDFGVLGTGNVSSIKVNGERSGPFHACLHRRMRSVKFPKYDGNLTRASFSLSLQ